ncbi:MAG: holo-ACP synthase [Clostridia bacterium]|nr:holo-ACP synthase [Clostridia bacterium]
MIIGIGCDLSSTERWEDEDMRERLMNRYYSIEEAEYVRSRGRPAKDSAAGIFAAKEAFVKALGTGFIGIPLAEIGVTHDALGAPKYSLTGKAAEAFRQSGADRCHLSISHDGGMAMAFCILEKREEVST